MRSRSIHDKYAVADDMASDLVCEYFSLPEFDRPQTESTLQVWCYKLARKTVRKYSVDRSIISIEAAAARLGDTREEAALDLLMSGSVMHRQKPAQEIHLEVQEALKFIARLPSADAKLVLAVIDHGNVAEFAKDRGVSLFQAMDDLTRARELMRRIREDDADEKREQP